MAIRQALKLFIAREHRCPRDISNELVTRGHLERFPWDPWDRRYGIEQVDGGFEILTLGRDGQRGGEDEDADIRENVVCPYRPPDDAPRESSAIVPRADIGAEPDLACRGNNGRVPMKTPATPLFAPSAELSRVIGTEPVTKPEAVERFWE